MTVRRLAALLLVAICAAGVALEAQSPPPGSVFRVFLVSGDPLPSYGEAAIVGDRVVFTLLVGAETDPRRGYQLLDLPTTEVDLDRTVAYANSVRGAHYAATRGEAEYAAMTADVSRALGELPGVADVAARLRAAEAARERMRVWAERSYGYRRGDLEALEELFDVVLAELREDAGVTRIAVELSANGLQRAGEPLRPSPDTAESVELALKAASIADTGAERLAILKSAEAVLTGAGGHDDLAARVRARTAAEEVAESRYGALVRSQVQQADAALGRGDPAAVAAIVEGLDARDLELGRMRPRLVRELRRQLDLTLSAARAYRAALDHYNAVRPTLIAYERRVRAALSTMDGLRPIIEAVREMRFTSFDRLGTAATRVEGASRALEAVTPPRDLEDVHATLVSGVYLAREAIGRRRTAAATAAGSFSRDAASAAAGALLLMGQARSDLVARLYPPKPPLTR